MPLNHRLHLSVSCIYPSVGNNTNEKWDVERRPGQEDQALDVIHTGREMALLPKVSQRRWRCYHFLHNASPFFIGAFLRVHTRLRSGSRQSARATHSRRNCSYCSIPTDPAPAKTTDEQTDGGIALPPWRHRMKDTPQVLDSHNTSTKSILSIDTSGQEQF